ncbi:MAG: ATP-binding protein [Nitrospirae bacterium]|jgi:predicted AAA+ superfamily ATPase|nr:ATP-binding protein [Nitrospirota bacterium]
MIKRLLKLPTKKSFFLLGPRQTGKTTLINNTYLEKVYKINLLLSDQFLKYSKDPSLLRKEVLEKKQKINYVFIDEIQRLPELLNEVQYLIDNTELQFILTGSSARKLKRGYANLLGGRAVQRLLFPFLWQEISDRADLLHCLRFGSLPPVFIAETEQEKIDILNAYVEVYLKEEIKSEGIVRHLGSFSRFLDMAASQFGEIVSYSSIARECRQAVMTVKTYYEILTDTLIGFRLEPWRKSLRKRLTGHPKFYFFDNGVTNIINGYNQNITDPNLLGRLFEQFIIIETMKHIKTNQSMINLYYWRTNTGAEVDMLTEHSNRILGAYEIKWSKTVTSAQLTGLKSFQDDYPDIPCYVICNTDEPYRLGNVLVLNWKQFLEEHNLLMPIK